MWHWIRVTWGGEYPVYLTWMADRQASTQLPTLMHFLLVNAMAFAFQYVILETPEAKKEQW
jgi:hypothetical protein